MGRKSGLSARKAKAMRRQRNTRVEDQILTTTRS